MDTRTRKRIQEMRSMTNEQLLTRQAELVLMGMERARRFYEVAMKEQPRISGPMIQKVNQRVKELAFLSTNSVDNTEDKSND
jgi:hypothetical protein